MCGLVGMVGDISYQARNIIFRDMLEICQLRGRDSTGVIHVDKDLEYDFVKRVGVPGILLDTREYEAKVEKKDAVALIGHTRSKTVGDVNLKNAHPFDYPEQGIIGVHNGTLRNTHRLHTHNYHKVDSEILYGHMAEHGALDALETAEGAFACVWWDNNEKTINFARNAERPLFFTWSEDLKTMFWASEPWWFGAVERKVKLWDGGESKQRFVELPVHQIWSFRINPNPKGEEKYLTQRPVQAIVPRPIVYPVRRDWSASKEDGSWERVGQGAWRRGGEVPRPFPTAREELNQIWDRIEDDLPFELQPTPLLALPAPTVIDSENSGLSNVAFLRHSITSSDTAQAQKPTNSSSRKILSLAEKNSKSFQSENSVVPFVDTRNSRKTSKPTIRLGVSHRNVAGVAYVTQNPTSTEYAWPVFLDNTGGKCCFCKETIQHPHEVGEIISEDKFVCSPCLIEPKGSLIIPKKKYN